MNTSLSTPTITSPQPSTTSWPALPTHESNTRPPDARPQPLMPPPGTTTLSAPLSELLARLKPLPSSTMLERIFTDLWRVLDFLRLAEDGCRQERLTLATISVLKNVRKQGQAVVELIASPFTGDAAELEQLSRAALDSISQQLTTELECVFNVELAGMEQGVQSAEERVKMKSAHEQLRACFQQSILTLAQVFEPSLEAENLFDDFATPPPPQLLTLADDLWNVIKYARRAAVERDPFAIAVLTEHLRRFCDGSKGHLKYQDWEACTTFIEQLTKPQRIAETIPLVEGLCCHLETLLTQIKRNNSFAATSPTLPATQT